MKKVDFKAIALSMALTCGAMSLSAASASASISPDSPLGKSMEGVHKNREFRGPKGFTVDNLNTVSDFGKQKKAAKDPSYKFDDLPRFEYMEGPDGTVWYYVVEYDIESVKHNDYWTEDLIMGYTFTIYDNSFNVVGSIKDKVELLENETRAREILLDPTITSRFYNNDDKYEVMVYHVMNTEQYVNHYYYKVYSIGGDIDEEGNDICIGTVEGRCADAVNIGGKGADENFFITFVHDPVLREKSEFKTDQEYVDYLNTVEYTLITYSKVVGQDWIKELTRKGIKVTAVPGDTTDGIYFISKKFNGDLYFIYSHYEKPYLLEPVLVNGNENATPDNSFIIETYKVTTDGLETVSTTTIPIDYPDSSEALTLAYYSIGSVAWSRDVDMSVNGAPSAPAFIVAHDIEVVPTEEFISNYEIYGADGKLIKTIASGPERMLMIENQAEEPQVMFINFDDQEGIYTFSFVNIYSCEEQLSIDQRNGGDPLMATCGFVKDGEGKSHYVFQCQNDEIDENTGKQYIRAAWFDDKGKLERTDKMNVGNNVQVAQINLDPAGLHPDIYDDDDAMEYAILVKRTYGVTTRNEFIVTDDSGDFYATFTADDGRGDPYMFTLLPGETNRIMMAYATPSTSINIDLYDLPFVEISESGVESIETAAPAALRYDGSAVYAAESRIEVYSTAGVLMARGNGSVSVEALAEGVYVVVATNAAGNREIAKIRK